MILASVPVRSDLYDRVFSPLQTDSARMSPDGQRVAYTFRKGSDLAVRVLELAANPTVTAEVVVADNRRTGTSSFGAVARLEWFDWVTEHRLAVVPNWSNPLARQAGALLAFDADGGRADLIALPRDLGSSSFRVVELDRNEPGRIKVAYVRPRHRGLFGGSASVWEESTWIDSVTGRQTDGPAVHRAPREAWSPVLPPHRGKLPMAERERFSRHLGYPEIDILSSDAADRRFAVLMQGWIDPGEIAVLDRGDLRLWSFAPRSEAIHELAAAHRVESFEFMVAGQVYPGVVVLPAKPRLARAPMVLLGDLVVGTRLRQMFDPRALALAEMGLAVVRVHSPKAPTTAERDWVDLHGDRWKAGMAAVAERFAVASNRALIVSEGGFAPLATEMARRDPERFSGMVVVDPVDDARVRTAGGTVQRSRPLPVLLAVRPGRPDVGSGALGRVKRIANVDRYGLEETYGRGNGTGEAALYRRIAAFLEERVYHATTQIGEAEVVAAGASAP